MENYSKLILKNNFSVTTKEQIVDSVCSKTGFSKDIATQIFESQEFNGMSTESIIEYFNGLSKPKGLITSGEFLDTLIDVVKDLTLDQNNKSEYTNRFLQLLNDNTSTENDNYIDSVNLISIVKDILIAKNPKSESILKGIMSTSELTTTDLTSLNESFNLVVPTEEIENTVKLYEGLKTILAKNNRRWGNAYHLDNAYQTIMSYIDKEIEGMELDKNMVSVDTNYQMMILNDFLTGNVSPVYKHISSVKGLVSDYQTLVFDMMLIVNRYIENREGDLMFASRQIVNDFRSSATTLINMLSNSTYSSKILNDEFKKGTNCDEFAGWSGSSTKTLREYGNAIDQTKLSYDLYSISLKTVFDLLYFIKSASTEFKLEMRPVMRTYITKGLELANTVERARQLRTKNNIY